MVRQGKKLQWSAAWNLEPPPVRVATGLGVGVTASVCSAASEQDCADVPLPTPPPPPGEMIAQVIGPMNFWMGGTGPTDPSFARHDECRDVQGVRAEPDLR